MLLSSTCCARPFGEAKCVAGRSQRQQICRSSVSDRVTKLGHLTLVPSLLLLHTGPSLADVAVIEGPARVVDGDTIYINKEKIRLYGVDAPEKAQLCLDAGGKEYPCGAKSLDALTFKLASRNVKCSVKNKDQYGRNVASCSVQQGAASEDVGEWLVSNGYAVAYRQYSKDYISAEDTAKAGGRGVWQGKFQLPAEWRKGNRTSQQSFPTSQPSLGQLPQQNNATLAAAAATTTSTLGALATGLLPSQVTLPSAPDLLAQTTSLASTALSTAPPLCPGPPIKGNINSKGEKIYHVPGGTFYDKVQIVAAEGERYFCTEKEAQAAGWRAAKK